MTNKKNIALWTSLGLGSLVLFSGLISFTAPKSVFYKGLDELGSQAQASVLSAPTHLDSAVADGINFNDIVKENSARVATPVSETSAPTSINDAPQLIIDTTKIAVPTADAASMPAPISCTGSETPIIQNGDVVGCSPAPTLAPTSARTSQDAAPVAAIAPAPARQTCESQNLFTYTGSDRPGLLYGMCIQCTTDVYLNTGGKC